MDVDRVGHRVHHAWEHVGVQSLECGQRTGLVLVHEPAEADHIGGENGCQTALHIAFVHAPTSSRAPAKTLDNRISYSNNGIGGDGEGRPKNGRQQNKIAYPPRAKFSVLPMIGTQGWRLSQ